MRTNLKFQVEIFIIKMMKNNESFIIKILILFYLLVTGDIFSGYLSYFKEDTNRTGDEILLIMDFIGLLNICLGRGRSYRVTKQTLD